ncbi:hypothetical protein EJB05_52823 [Eragrostis curvula]|uniref:Embryo surrounding factor 1 brassicaceae domain-containing protein n=1 Tax=Eragrostis curvula TaxID=38414 RepID=A0A5J9SRS9_9POAL|nr:hypothetical protein EJB05_52823 [Eragrostis curvula]
MRGCGSYRDGVVYVRVVFIFIVLFGCLALPTQCRLKLTETASTVSIVNSTSLEQSKIYLVFCISGRCNYFGGWKDCYCCLDMYRKENCHETQEECKAKCIVCDPNCHALPPPQLSNEDMWVNAKTNITLTE